MKVVGTFREPSRGYKVKLALVEPERLVPGRFRRELSTPLANKLVRSVDYGFFIPLVVTPWGEKFEVLDGQHRLEALRKRSTQVVEVPVLIVPPELAKHPSIFNVEKGDSIRDKGTKVHRAYMWLVEHEPQMPEADFACYCGWEFYVIPIGFAYRECALQSPSLVETAAKKLLNSPIDEALDVAIDVRRAQARELKRLEEAVLQVAEEHGIKDFNLKKGLITSSQSLLWGRARTVNQPFADAITDLIATIEARAETLGLEEV